MNAGDRVYMETAPGPIAVETGWGYPSELEYARVVTGHERVQRYDGELEAVACVLVEFEDCGSRAWVPVRRLRKG